MCETRKSNLLGKITVLFVICCFSLPAQAKYGGGTGEPNDPYLIYTAEQMNTIGACQNDWDRHFKLMADIDLSGFTGTSFNIIGNRDIPFAGIFDGNNHTISNLSYTCAGTNYIGLFGYVNDPNAEIKDLGLIDPNVDTVGDSWSVGSLVGYLRNGTITNCYVKGGDVCGDWNVGGLVGYNDHGTINNCYSTGSVSGDNFVGGLIGWVYRGTITNCYSTGSVEGNWAVGGLAGWGDGTIANSYSTCSVLGDDNVGGLVGDGDIITNCCAAGDVEGENNVGGLIGYGDRGKITNCYSTGTVSGCFGIGGLFGCNYQGTITNCYSSGDVIGDWYVGGLVGYNYRGLLEQCYSSCWVSGSFDVGGLVGYTSGIVVNCYAAGSVSGYHNIGGLVGSNNRGMVTNCYATGSVSGSSGTGGLVGYNFSGTIIHSFWDIDSTGQTGSSGGGEGKSTVEMQMANTFFAWSICGNEGIWSIDDNNDYPYLTWELKPGQPIDNPELSEILQGNGTKEQPYLIYTENDLNTIGQYFCELGVCPSN